MKNEYTLASQFQNDSRLKKAKELIKETLKDYKKKIVSSKIAQPHLKKSYDQLLKQFSSVRIGPLWLPYVGSGLGNGALVELADGSIKWDMITGIGAHVFGHSHLDFVMANVQAALSDTVMQGNLQQNQESHTLMKQFLSIANKGYKNFDHCFLSTSGAMANENALKIIFQKQYPKDRILAFDRNFCGRTLALAQITDKSLYRSGLPSNLSVDYVPFFDEKSGKKSYMRTLYKLEKLLNRYPGQHAVMVLELIQGEGGYYPGSNSFFKDLLSILRKNNIAVFIDEVQTFGRTSEAFAFQHFGLDGLVDVISVGKMTQVCATLMSKKYCPKPGLVSQTFTGSTSSIHSAILLLDKLKNNKFFGPGGLNIKLHRAFIKHFKKLEKKHAGVFRGPYGLGGMIAFTVFDGDVDLNKTFIYRLFDNGVIAFLAGLEPMRVRMLPPIIDFNFKEIPTIIDIIDQTIQDMKSEQESK